MILDGNTKNVEITVPIKCFSNFRRTLEMPFINYEINLMKIVLFFAKGAAMFAITHTKLYVLIINTSINDNVKLFQQLKIGFKRTISCNKYQSQLTIERQNQYLY